MGLKAVVAEVVGGRYYTRHPIEMVRYVQARSALSRHWHSEPDTVLANLGLDASPFLDDYERWKPTFLEMNEKGNDYLGFQTGVTLYTGKAQYLMIRALRPQVVIETGIASGVSTTHLGAALIDNGEGSLYSVELPHDESAQRYERYGAKYEATKPPGWAIPTSIPEQLGDRLNLVFEDVRTALPRLLDEVGPIDVFIHDDLHTPKHMAWEFNLVWPRLNPGGILGCDNAEAAWLDFARSVGAPNGGRDTVGGFAAVRKPAG